MKWFKFYGQDYISDPKMLSLTAEERSCWITILSYASVNDNGKITFLSEYQLMIQAGLDAQDECWDKTVGVLEKLKKLKMITLDNGEITILNWQKRQETNLTSYERVKRYRQKKRDDNTKITLDKNRIEKNRIDNTNTAETSSAEIAELIKSFETINPASKKYYGNKTQRTACQTLIDAYGFDRVKMVIETTLPKTNTLEFFPTITTPIQLWEKWASLESAIRKYQNKITKTPKAMFS